MGCTAPASAWRAPGSDVEVGLEGVIELLGRARLLGQDLVELRDEDGEEARRRDEHDDAEHLSLGPVLAVLKFMGGRVLERMGSKAFWSLSLRNFSSKSKSRGKEKRRGRQRGGAGETGRKGV